MQTKPFRIILHLPQDAPLMLSQPPSHPPHSTARPLPVIPSPEFEFASGGSSRWERKEYKKRAAQPENVTVFFPI